MDPKQTLKNMQDYIRIEMWDEAAECANALTYCLEQGGVSPFPFSRTTAITYLKSIVSRAQKLKSLGAN